MRPQTSHIVSIAQSLIAVAAGILAFAATAVAASDDASRDAPIHANWTALPLRDVAEQLGRLSGMAVIVDRRIDPTTPITLDAEGHPFAAVAHHVAAQAGADVAWLEGMVRIAPEPAAAMSEEAERQSAAERRRLPAAQRRILDADAPWAWDAGARPRDLVAEAAAATGIAIDGLDAIPHDHFPAFALPTLPLATRLDAVLAHFDRRVTWSAGRAGKPPQGRIVPMTVAPAGAARRRPSVADGGRPRTPVDAAVAAGQVFTLRVEAPLEQVLATVTKRLGLTLDLDRASLAARGIAPQEIVRTKVENASREALLDAILEPLGLRWNIEGRSLAVWAPADD